MPQRLAGSTRWTPPVVFAAAAVLGLGAPGALARGASEIVTLSIVGTADRHGRLDAEQGRGGLPLFGGYLAALRGARASDGGGVVLVDAGDTFQGGIASNLSEGAVVIDAYNALGYTALAVGNHDFEYGAVDAWPDAPSGRADPRGALKARAAQAQFPFLAANLIDASTGETVTWPNVRPSVVVDVAGVKVGLVGVMTAPALSMTLAANVEGLAVTALAPAIAREAARLRAGGAVVVVAVAHAGGACERVDDADDLASCDPGAEMFEVVRRLPSGTVDAVVGGHTHAAVAHRVHGVPMVQAYYWGRWFSRVDLAVDRRAGRVVQSTIFPPQEICAHHDRRGGCATAGAAAAPARYEGRAVTPDPAVAAAMMPALARVEALRATALGVTLDAAVQRASGAGESALGNLYADALRAALPGTDVAVTFGSGPGGLRADLAAGPLALGPVYDTFPFDNRVARLALTGDGLGRLIRDRIRRPRWRGRAFGVSGVQVRLDCGQGDVEVRLRWPSGAPVAPDARLAVATTDFLASWIGGDRPPEPRTAVEVLDLQLRDAVTRWLGAQGPTLRASRFADPARPRWADATTADCTAR